jgi:hypothetical protein
MLVLAADLDSFLRSKRRCPSFPDSNQQNTAQTKEAA